MRLSLFLLSAFLVFACGKSLPTLHGIDTGKWKEDKQACLGYRTSIQSSLDPELPKLKGLSEMDILQLLGRPDQNELYKRNQKFYYYFIEAGPGCEKADSTSLKLVVRFNAMGYAQRVSIE
jgi:hypothetical protein